MAEDILRYDKIVEGQLRGVVRVALEQVMVHGLTGNHSLYITFKTQHPGIAIPDNLVAEYPDEMTIVIEHQYWDLEVDEDGFQVSLNFNKRRERLVIPLAAVSAFSDPSVQFGLRFEMPEKSGADLLTDAAMGETAPKASAAQDDTVDDSGSGSGGEVVNLDTFRKK